jgi:cytochrome c oxidase subunit III
MSDRPQATAHPTPPVAEHFESLAKQQHAGRLGMWAFLATELLLFAGLFALYATYRGLYPRDFHLAALHTHKALGTLNTVVLITSSFTVALSIHYARRGDAKIAFNLVMVTVVLGFVFLGVKSYEYSHHFREGIFPGQAYAFPALPQKGAKIFYTLYFFMTGLHVIHVIAGLAILLALSGRVKRGFYGPEHYLGIELGGMYWHLVDLIWIFLWPIFYLVE